jgi:hypothetical protein
MSDDDDVLSNFDIAISYASENRDIAEGIALGLKSKKIRVFYDQFFKNELWGLDLSTILEAIFNGRAKYCLMIVSEDYSKKYWTTKEKKFAIKQQVRKNNEYILQLKLDDTKLPGISKNLSYLRYEGIEKAINSIKMKLDYRKTLEKKTTYSMTNQDIENKIYEEYGHMNITLLNNILSQKKAEAEELGYIISSMDEADDLPEQVKMDIIRKKRIKESEIAVLFDIITNN